MIITQTPLRVGLVGGGTDLPDYYREHGGRVLNAAIDKYVYVVVKQRFDDDIYVNYSQKEIVSRVEDLQHELVREALHMTGIRGGVEITTLADIPSAGSGLGSSSAVTVGLLQALFTYQGRQLTAEELADRACAIEIDRCRKPIGKQDQYAAAFGGLNYVQFNPDDSVFVEPVIAAPATKVALQDRLLMFYSGLRGDNTGLLREQSEETAGQVGKRDILGRMVELAGQMREALSGDDLTDFGRLLHENWELKKLMASGISNPQLDLWYEAGRAHGALGGKLLGAGGSGFLLFYCEPERQDELIRGLAEVGLREFPFRFEPQGSRIIYVGD
jgi:D-glycero-alpha-D-manno-heptose-7-phosphate kinase